MTMEKTDYKRTKLICYFANLAMSSVFSLPPMLFATFREMYGISYTLLGTLVLVNFCTQLGINLVFSFFSGYFNIHKTIRLMPLITAAGLCIYALVPMLFPRYAYLGLITGTCVFSVAAGLGEVLVSPTVAAIPSDNPDKDMSMLHALYGYGFVGVVLISTLFLRFVGKEYWMYLTFFWAALPVVASLLLTGAPLPDMDMGQSGAKAAGSKYRTKGLLLCMGCIFLGACAENTMSNWVSVYAEIALGIPKIWGGYPWHVSVRGVVGSYEDGVCEIWEEYIQCLDNQYVGSCRVLCGNRAFPVCGIIRDRLCGAGHLRRHALAGNADFHGRKNTGGGRGGLCFDGGGGRPWRFGCAPDHGHRGGQPFSHKVGGNAWRHAVPDAGTSGVQGGDADCGSVPNSGRFPSGIYEKIFQKLIVFLPIRLPVPG